MKSFLKKITIGLVLYPMIWFAEMWRFDSGCKDNAAELRQWLNS